MSPVETDEEPSKMFEYRILRYLPNRARDEWVNIGVLLEETSGARRAMRLIEEPAEFARVRRVHPAADENLLRSLSSEFDARLRAPSAGVHPLYYSTPREGSCAFPPVDRKRGP